MFISIHCGLEQSRSFHVYTMYRVEGVWSSTVLENGLTIKVSLISSKDVRLPVQLQRAMAAEAEAAREARAKVR